MSLIVESGAGLSTAESFCSVAYANAYHTARGVPEADWADLDTDVKEQLLRKATDHMEQRYGMRWRGYRMFDTQALSWPRGYVHRGDYVALTAATTYVADDSVPTIVANACAELALRQRTEDLSPDLGRETIEEQIGPIRVKYATGSRESTMYSDVDSMLARYLLPFTSGAMRSLVRS